MKRRKSEARDPRQEILRHWRDQVPNDRLAHLVRDAGRSCVRALQMRLTEHDVSFGHWTFLRILWQADGLTQRELSARADLARKEGRPEDAAELEQRVQGYREELAERP